MRHKSSQYYIAGLCFCAMLFIAGCGYMESAFNPVQGSRTTLSGRIVDTLSKKGIPGVKITLRSKIDVLVSSGENGLFQFNEVFTGIKELVVALDGYKTKSLQVDMEKGPNILDTLFLCRNNHPPVIDKLVYPSNYPTVHPLDIPLSIQFTWSFSDLDYDNAFSAETLRYRFYFGKDAMPQLIDSGVLDIKGLNRDSSLLSHLPFIAFKPDSLISGLCTNTVYHWRIVIRDLMGDSCVSPNCSFTTRRSFTHLSLTCPVDSLDSMVLIEMENNSFCMDQFEVSNNEYAKVFYPSDPFIFLRPESLSRYSPTTTTPIENISMSQAESLCVKRGKRLCSISEWKIALGGYRKLQYPYGDVYDSTKCNTNNWTSNQFLGTSMPVDRMDSCVSSYGIYDLSGNVAEWVTLDDASRMYYDPFDNEGNHLDYYAGGFWSSMSNSGIKSVFYLPTGDKALNIGFRCCKNVR